MRTSELRFEGHVSQRLPDRSIFRQPLTTWTAYSRFRTDDPDPALSPRCGNIEAKNPDREFRRKMWCIARVLKAKVQGDDGEFYDRFGNPTPDPSRTDDHWRALFRHLGFKFIWGDPVGS